MEFQKVELNPQILNKTSIVEILPVTHARDDQPSFISWFYSLLRKISHKLPGIQQHFYLGSGNHLDD